LKTDIGSARLKDIKDKPNIAEHTNNKLFIFSPLKFNNANFPKLNSPEGAVVDYQAGEEAVEIFQNRCVVAVVVDSDYYRHPYILSQNDPAKEYGDHLHTYTASNPYRTVAVLSIQKFELSYYHLTHRLTTRFPHQLQHHFIIRL